jgi:hypothetical protein
VRRLSNGAAAPQEARVKADRAGTEGYDLKQTASRGFEKGSDP